MVLSVSSFLFTAIFINKTIWDGSCILMWPSHNIAFMARFSNRIQAWDFERQQLWVHGGILAELPYHPEFRDIRPQYGDDDHWNISWCHIFARHFFGHFYFNQDPYVKKYGLPRLFTVPSEQFNAQDGMPGGTSKTFGCFIAPPGCGYPSHHRSVPPRATSQHLYAIRYAKSAISCRCMPKIATSLDTNDQGLESKFKILQDFYQHM